MSLIRPLALGCALATCGVTLSHAQADRAPARLAGDQHALRIFVGPDFRVNRESDAPHFETHVDADPKRPRQLVGASIAEPGGRSVAWRSDDGGFIWRQIRFPGEPQHQRMYASGDPQVAYTKEGTALFVTMSWRSQAKRGRGIDIFRSPDGGVTWDTATFVFGDYSVDHPQLATDRTSGRFAGRSYVTFLHGYPSYDLSIVRSDDDGRTWSAPHRYVTSPPEPDGSRFHGVNTLNTIVFHDGTLFLPFSRFDFDTSGRGVGASGTGAVISRDGGETVGPRIEIFPMRPSNQIGRWDFSLRRSLQFAVDASNGRFADRLYCVVTEYEGNRLRLMLTSSRDHGEHWTPLRPVTPELPAHASQFQPAIAVNREGVVGIYWFDTRRWPRRDRFDVYFTASTDGGETFLSAVPINSAPSDPRGLGNLAPTSGSEGNEQLGATVVVSSMFSYRGSGGDYVGMTADADGVFHPLWPDARSGTYHVWTARVEVAPAMTEPRASSENAMVSLKDKAVLITDPGWYDATTREVVLPVRVKNVSSEDIIGPIRVTIPRAWQGGPRAGPNAPPAPRFTNAKSDGRPDSAVYYDYSNILGDRGVLRPGDVSGAIAWRVLFGDSVQLDFLRFTSEISGVLRPASAGAR